MKSDFPLQFLPSKIKHLESVKYVDYKGVKVKSTYLIDIVHGLLMRYYFRGENYYHLSSTVMKEKYGQYYNFYIGYLSDIGVIKMCREYFKGRNTRAYCLDVSVINGNTFRYRNVDKFLLKKSTKRRIDNVSCSTIIAPVRKKLIEDLKSVTVDFERSMFYLNSLKDVGSDAFNKNLYSIESINGGDIFYHFDSYGRLHTNFTILKSFIRKNCLLIDGEETAEIDIQNSQPLFLSKLIESSGTKWVRGEELELFKDLVTCGKYYQYLMNRLGAQSREEVKSLTYKVFFGQNRKNSKSDILFSSLFPTIHNFIKLYKKEYGDYKILSHHLQSAESNLIFNRIVSRIMDFNPNIRIVTVHDSLMVQRKWHDVAANIFHGEISSHFDTDILAKSNI